MDCGSVFAIVVLSAPHLLYSWAESLWDVGIFKAFLSVLLLMERR